MAEPFKNMINNHVISNMARQFKNNWPEFDSSGFIAAATKDLDALELKARTDHVTEAMIHYLPKDFEATGKILLASLGSPGEEQSPTSQSGITGWPVIALTNYVAQQGLEHFDFSLNLLKEMTKCATSEFAIRVFLTESPEKTLSTLKKWTNDRDEHVRRLVSEGTRPRLPWAMHLPIFIDDPSPVIELLELLKDDEHEYVRRSVANNLNDIAKDHPDLVAEIATEWMKNANKERKKLIRHACRSLIKSGHKQALEILGYQTPKIHKTNIDILTPVVTLGEALEFTLSISSSTANNQPLMIDYIIHHQKANGKTSPKVFKWKTSTLPSNKTLSLTKRHAIKPVTTRVYYPGLHSVEVVVNGISVAKAGFELLMP
ncbi:MAG: DNA alkylation repair protein [Gammaproteobacteria bacterium]|nr:DNA alkylation repair protein [Gammaproteobacteria bacterium]